MRRRREVRRHRRRQLAYRPSARIAPAARTVLGFPPEAGCAQPITKCGDAATRTTPGVLRSSVAATCSAFTNRRREHPGCRRWARFPRRRSASSSPPALQWLARRRSAGTVFAGAGVSPKLHIIRFDKQTSVRHRRLLGSGGCRAGMDNKALIRDELRHGALGRVRLHGGDRVAGPMFDPKCARRTQRARDRHLLEVFSGRSQHVASHVGAASVVRTRVPVLKQSHVADALNCPTDRPISEPCGYGQRGQHRS
jgi:hypothetical protein